MAESVLLVMEGAADLPLVDVMLRAGAAKALRSSSSWVFNNRTCGAVVATLTGFLPAHARAVVCELLPASSTAGRVVFVLQPGRPGAQYLPLVNALRDAGAKRILRAAWMFEDSTAAAVEALAAGYLAPVDRSVVSDVGAWQGKTLLVELSGARPKGIPPWVGGGE